MAKLLLASTPTMFNSLANTELVFYKRFNISFNFNFNSNLVESWDSINFIFNTNPSNPSVKLKKIESQLNSNLNYIFNLNWV